MADITAGHCIQHKRQRNGVVVEEGMQNITTESSTCNLFSAPAANHLLQVLRRLLPEAAWATTESRACITCMTETDRPYIGMKSMYIMICIVM